MTKHYEYTYLTRQDMTEEEAKQTLDKLTESITAKSGVIADLPKAYKKRLAYPIKKQEAAYVNTILFQMEPGPLDEFKKESAIMTEILRGLVISYDPEKLKREIRRETGGEEQNGAETAKESESPAPETAKPETAKTIEAKVEEKPEPAKEEEKEEKKEEPIKETVKEEAKEEKLAKPKRKTKVKTELRDIEKKLDEILK